MISHYDWSGGREAMLRFGPDTGPVVVAALPLFEEANRTRAFVVTILRALAERGIASALPDLPGTGESIVPTSEMTLMRLHEAYEAAVDTFDSQGRHCYGVSLRSGVLMDTLGLLYGRWYLAPQSGPELKRELTRIKRAELGREAKKLTEYWYYDNDLPEDAADPPVEIAGNLVPADLMTELSAALLYPKKNECLPRRTVRLETDPKPADLKISAAPLWRRAEPDNDSELAVLLADDIAAWVRQCEG
ncbi:hypothetical protein [Sphingomonas sp. G-3-2-10]|uniref:hypothetical protein n=1 Tax=Sphingomonas sp. G-3-2-10 TaxID=2728838 RepID=UPI00146CA0E1|nr:hypothetical protein [Sphingomonas sp. G-3-2-10]NML04563.1 hypothetical protein [Sphingomonas sp. G-3-2-10]